MGQVWSWLEESGLEINTACMNAYVSTLVKQVRMKRMQYIVHARRLGVYLIKAARCHRSCAMQGSCTACGRYSQLLLRVRIPVM